MYIKHNLGPSHERLPASQRGHGGGNFQSYQQPKTNNQASFVRCC